LRRAARTQGRGTGAGQQTGTGSFGGGGVIADFTTLMNLIQENTSGKWEVVDGEGGTMSPFPTGVRVAPNGLLHKLSTQEHTGELASLGASARKADLNADVARRSELRMVSLTRLEKAVSQRLADGQSVPETMAQLAGLSQVKYVFVYPDANEIVLAGPAEGWQYNAQGQPVAVSNGRPTLQLDDLWLLDQYSRRGSPRADRLREKVPVEGTDQFDGGARLGESAPAEVGSAGHCGLGCAGRQPRGPRDR
jgi:hypothetical protein